MEVEKHVNMTIILKHPYFDTKLCTSFHIAGRWLWWLVTEKHGIASIQIQPDKIIIKIGIQIIFVKSNGRDKGRIYEIYCYTAGSACLQRQYFENIHFIYTTLYGFKHVKQFWGLFVLKLSRHMHVRNFQATITLIK